MMNVLFVAAKYIYTNKELFVHRHKGVCRGQLQWRGLDSEGSASSQQVSIRA
jgi:hypothetical protein